MYPACFALFISIIASILVLPATHADTLTVGSKTIEGKLVGYSQSRFLFKDKAGKKYKQLRSQVKDLGIETPYRITYKQSGKKDPQDGILLGYNSGQYMLVLNGKETKIPGVQIREIRLNGTLQTETAGQAGPRPIDVAALAGRKDLTAAQMSALKRYATARKKHEAFQQKSSDMVTQMDSAKGNRRLELLAALRARKNEEQPLVNELQVSKQALEAAIPDMHHAAAAEGITGANEEQSEIILTMPKSAEGTIVMIDTDFFRQNLKVSQTQTDAIDHYTRVQKVYADYVPEQTEEGAVKLKQLTIALQQAQQALLKAFPELKIVYE